MMSIRLWAATLATWFCVTYVLCVGWCLLAPEGWTARSFLEMVLPGFQWLSVGSFVLGLVESALTGAYSGALVAFLHNRLAVRNPEQTTEPIQAVV